MIKRMNDYARIVLSEYGMRRFTYELINRYTSGILRGGGDSYYILNRNDSGIGIDLPDEAVNAEEYLNIGGAGYRRMKFPRQDEYVNL